MADTQAQEKPKPEVGPQSGDDEGKVGVMLAHPLSKASLRRLYLPEDTPANVHDVIVVTQDQALSLIGAGMVQVNPTDTKAVDEIVRGAERTALGVEPSATSGNDNVVSGSGASYDELKGDALKEALNERGLPQKGTAAEQRKAIADHDAANPPQG